jgi:phosphatidylglycerol:prolipoprotein diacylglycerol transferase
MRASEFGIDSNKVIDLMIIMLISGIAGARVFYILQNLSYYIANPREIPNLSRGGLVWYGAFIAGLSASALYMKNKGMDFWSTADLAAPYIALAQAVGRIGCFMNGCCYGTETSPGHFSSVSAIFLCAQPDGSDAVLRYPAQLYSAASLLLIFAVLRIWQDHRRFRGEIFLGYCAAYSSKRFLMEFIRGDNPRIFLGLTISQLISCGVFAFSAAILIHMSATWKKRQ